MSWKKHLSKHHRKCRSNGGSNAASNISFVTVEAHRAWHFLFQNKTPEEIAKIINEVWIESSVQFVVVKK